MHIVLSGSGINLGAHAGALYEIVHEVGEKKEEDISGITAVSGGSIIGGLYAAGYKPDDIIEVLRKFDFKKVTFTLFPLFNVIFRGYIYNDSYINKSLKHFFGDITLGSTQIPLNVVVTNNEGKTCVFSSEKTPKVSLFDAVRASMSAPFIFKSHKGFYDGGITNNIPIDLTECPHDSVIGVKVFSEKDHIGIEKKHRNFLDTAIFLLKTLMNALDREHIEEHVDRIIFIPCPNSSFDFNIPELVKEFHIVMGRYMAGKFFGKVNGNVFSQLIDLHNEILNMGYGLRRIEKYLSLNDHFISCKREDSFRKEGDESP